MVINSKEMGKYIKRIRIRNLWSKGDIDWEVDSDVSVLIGANGTGKSTILRLVYEALAKSDLEIDFEVFNNIDKLIIDFHDGSSISIDNGFRKLVGITDEDIRVDKVDTFDVPLFKSKFTVLDTAIDGLREPFIRYQRDLLKKIEQAFLHPDDTEIDKIARESLARKNLFIKIINELFAPTKKKFLEESFDFKVGEQVNPISPYQLSSGEKQVFVILLTTLLQDNQPYILFLDEPEISLHLDWQRALISKILSLNVHVQIIMATHSPSVYFRGWTDKIARIEEISKEGGLDAQEESSKWQSSDSRGFSEWFEKEISTLHLNGNQSKIQDFNREIAKRSVITLAESESLLKYLEEQNVRPNIFTFIYLLGLATSYEESLQLFEASKKAGIKPNALFTVLVNNARNMIQGLSVLNLMDKAEVLPDINIFSILLDKARTLEEVNAVETQRKYYMVAKDEAYRQKLKAKL